MVIFTKKYICTYHPALKQVKQMEKVLRLCRSLYGLKQSPRAWFDRFRQSMLKRGYIQSNADHTLFYKHATSKVAILIVYVDDIVITRNDIAEIVDLKKYLAQEFEVKDLG